MGMIGDAIVQNGATSIVGQCIIQLARIRGIHSINIIRDRCLFESFKEKLVFIQVCLCMDLALTCIPMCFQLLLCMHELR